MATSNRLTNASYSALIKGAIWTVGAYGINSLLRFATSIALTRLLAPELFGIMLIVNTLRTGCELVSDLGISQNIVYGKNAENPDFYNTAWTLQALRGVIVWLFCAVIAAPLAHFYHSPMLLLVTPVAALISVLMGLTSISVFLLRKRFQIAKLNSFEMFVAVSTTVPQVIVAYFSPTIWALVLGNIFGCALSTFASYFLLPDIKQRFVIFKDYAREILSFGKWIYLSSLVYFLSMNFDRLYLAKIIPLSLLGVYAIARTISDLLSGLVLQLSNLVIFPFITSHSSIPRDELRKQLTSIRLQFLLVAAVGLSLLASTADLLIRIVYDQRYQDVGWMLSVLILGVWGSILSSINEFTLLGFGKPNFGAIGNTFKFGFLVIGLIASVRTYGVPGGVIVVAFADLFRYLPVYVGQRREQFSFAKQDLLVTIAFIGLIGFWEYLRHTLGLGTSFDTWPMRGTL
jgi:O-antigen/teichoic acid export membrane protein